MVSRFGLKSPVIVVRAAYGAGTDGLPVFIPHVGFNFKRGLCGWGLDLPVQCDGCGARRRCGTVDWHGWGSPKRQRRDEEREEDEDVELMYSHDVWVGLFFAANVYSAFLEECTYFGYFFTLNHDFTLLYTTPATAGLFEFASEVVDGGIGKGSGKSYTITTAFPPRCAVSLRRMRVLGNPLGLGVAGFSSATGSGFKLSPSVGKSPKALFNAAGASSMGMRFRFFAMGEGVYRLHGVVCQCIYDLFVECSLDFYVSE